MEKPKEILELEKELGFKLRETRNFNDIVDSNKSKTYLLNDKKEIIGLNFFYCQLKNILFLNGLKDLSILNLSFNKILNYFFLKDLIKLNILKLDLNHISDYSFLKYLDNLTNLDLSRNQILDISFLKDLRNLNNLNLSRNNISDISFLKHLSTLTSLDLHSNSISDISFLKEMNNLTTLDLGSNYISDISFLKNSQNLTTLNLSGNYISDISFLKDLNNLNSLDLSGNYISDIFFLKNLDKLTILNLGFNKIANVSFLRDLGSLTNLNLSRNKISSILFLKNLDNLNSLDLSANQISDYSLLKDLNNLNNLYLSHSQISDISFLKDLNNLVILNLNKNSISDYSLLKDLDKLTNLYLNSNKISNIYFLKDLVNLTDLDLSYNQIWDISFLKNLLNLTYLDLQANQITDISLIFLNQFPKLKEIQLWGNPIQKIPKEIFSKQYKNVLQEVRTYLEDLEKGKTANKEIKLIFIGNGSVGKTQIAKRLCEQEKFVFDTEHQSTHAIALLCRELAGFELNCWDFAGQDIYHATHRLFMQTRALLVLVWDFDNETQDFHEWQGKKYENEKLLYWLEYAKYFAPESPILVLQNKVDALPQDLYFETKEKYKAEYPIIDFLPISAKTGEGFKVLERAMKNAFQTHTTFQTPPLPTNWVAVREEIRTLQTQTTHKTMTLAEFTALCAKYDCEKSASTLVDYLHDTGVLYYRQGYFNNQIILNQDWAIQAIYKVLNRESEYFEVLHYEKGKLDYELLCEIWATHTDQERALFIDFMLSAELAFETTENKKYNTPFENRTFIVPSCLSSEKPKDVQYWEQKNAAHLTKTIIEYRFLPKVFIQRFIVRASRFSTVSLLWQKGLLLKTTQGEALVEAFYEKEQQKIMISFIPNLLDNLEMKERYLLEKIKQELQEIAYEGKLNSKIGKVESDEEKFGLLGLTPIFDNTNQKTMTNYEKAIDLINTLQLAEYFSLMKSLVGENPTLTKLQQRFIMGKDDEDFYEQLKSFAEMMLKKDEKSKQPSQNSSPNLKTLYNTLKQQLNDESLNLFCQLNFEEVHNNFTTGQSKVAKISALLDYAKRKELLEKLEQDLKEFLAHS